MEQSQATGRSRGGRTTKIHALTDRACRPLAFLLTSGQAADWTAGALLLERLPACRNMLADKCNAIERMFGRLKNFRRIATRYDRSATNYLAATVSYWL